MKRLACIVALMLFSLFAIAQTTPYNVVFDLTSKDSVSQKSVIRWLNGILASNADAKLEVVMYGQGLDLVLRGKSLVSEEVTKLAQNKNVAFVVCAVAMKNHNIDSSQLLSGVRTVPDGIYEIITKEREG